MKPINQKSLFRLGRLLAGVAGLSATALTAQATVSYLGVAAGDASSTEATLWTRAVDGVSNPVALTALVATNSDFTGTLLTYSVNTDTNKDYTAKVQTTGLTPNTKYYYNFIFTNSSVTNISITGTFKTAPAANAATPVSFAFSGDCDGLIRPYALASQVPNKNLDFFMFDGDTIYETASSGSAAVTSSGNLPAPSSTGATSTNLYNDYSRKYREQFLPVNAGGQNCLQPFFAGQGNYTTYDNHELGNKQYINGGAPAGGAVGDFTSGAGVDARVSTYDVNTTGTFMNKSGGFQTLQQVFLNYQPIKDRGMISAPLDPRLDGTKQLYFAQPWGKNVLFVNTDCRSYRDIRMKTAANADDTGSRADNTNRTYLGATQLAWLESTLLAAQQAGTTWKFVNISDPIDQLGPIGGVLSLSGLPSFGVGSTYAPVSADGGKAWFGGYRAERNALLKFIADNQIRNVVFLATDDHQNRINELSYSTNSATGTQSTYVRVPYCFQVVCGPLGATGPDLITVHDFATLTKPLADSIANAQIAAGIDPIGLATNYPGLHNVARLGDPQADTLRQPADFYSPDTFNYNKFDVSADGKTLTVTSCGINSTAQNSFAEYNATTNAEQQIFSFQVDAADPVNYIDHFIVVYQENWSFDALYGNFPGANGIANASPVSLNQLDRISGNPFSTEVGQAYNNPSKPTSLPAQTVPPLPINGSSIDPNFPTSLNTLAPYDLNSYITPGTLTGDIVHRYWTEAMQIDGGANDKFVTFSDNPGLVMSHFDATSLPEGKLAQQYTMCDNFFHSAFGGSFLNHQFFIAAAAPVYPNAASIVPGNITALNADGSLSTNASGKWVNDQNITPIGGVCFANTNLTFDKNYAVNTIFSANLQSSGNQLATSLLPSQNNSNPGDLTRPFIRTIGDNLTAAGVSWKWYSGGWDRALAQSPSNPTHYGTTVTDPSISLFQWHHQAFAFFDNYAPFVAYTTYTSNPSLYPGGFNTNSAAHLQDETKFYADIASNTLPAVSFVKFMGPDNEHPGYASLLQGQLHVSNLVSQVQSNPALWAHTAIIITYDEHGGRWDHVAPPARDIWGPGVRVPCIIISPYAKTNHVEHTQYDTTTILSTIEHRFGVTPLNSLDATAPTFINALNTIVTDPSTPPSLGFISDGTNLSLFWPSVYLTYQLQANTNSLTAPSSWFNVTGVSNNLISIPIDSNQTNVFYRLVKP
jgi:acid phosphatase